MNTITISQKQINKHLSFHHYEFIINSLIQFNAKHKPIKHNTGKTQLIRNLASIVGTSVSNIYSIINDATIIVKDTHLVEHNEFSALATFNKRSKNHKIPHDSKIDKTNRYL